MNILTSAPASNLMGDVKIPGDKSISHRSLIMGTLSIGETKISGLLEGEDVLGTAQAMRQLGADIYKDDQNIWHIHGVGISGLKQPKETIEMGNSGTSVRLIMGLISTHSLEITFTGDRSLSSRPMKRVTDPLCEFGASFKGNEKGTLPITVTGTGDALPIEHHMKVASAQVKSALMLGALNTAGTSIIYEFTPSRDHTERMFRQFGVPISEEKITLENGVKATKITVTGQGELKPQVLNIPADPSSAAFPIVAALITKGSDITLKNIGLNPARTGLFITLQEMGADLTMQNERLECGEPVADIRVRYSKLKAITVPKERAPSMIDEYPVLCAAAAYAAGITVMRGLEELRIKESDRIAVMVEGLLASGVEVSEHKDGMSIKGGRGVKGGCTVKAHLDHRIAMSFLILGMNAQEPISVDDGTVIETSFPSFTALFNNLGANISTPKSGTNQ